MVVFVAECFKVFRRIFGSVKANRISVEKNANNSEGFLFRLGSGMPILRTSNLGAQIR